MADGGYLRLSLKHILAFAALFPLSSCVANNAANNAGNNILAAPSLSSPSVSKVANEDSLKTQNIIAIANLAADWQIANNENYQDYIRYVALQNANKRGWIQGTFFLGLADYALQSGQSDYYNPLFATADQQEWKLGDRPFHADDHLVGQVYIYLHRSGLRAANLMPTQSGLDYILANRPTNQMLHPDKPGDPRCANRWCWSDALFMAPATWWKAAQIMDRPDYRDFADEEFRTATKLLFDESEGLYYRDSRFIEQRGDDGEKLFWSRGNGWAYGGIVNILRAMPKNDPRREYYLNLYRIMSEKLISVQADNGLWRASLLATSRTPPETSGTGFFVYGLAWGMNEGIISGSAYQSAIEKGWIGLVNHVDSQGRLGYVQQVGDKPQDVRPDDHQFYGVGAFLLAAGQMIAFSERP